MRQAGVFLLGLYIFQSIGGGSGTAWWMSQRAKCVHPEYRKMNEGACLVWFPEKHYFQQPI
jgi:hypothetical protein